LPVITGVFGANFAKRAFPPGTLTTADDTTGAALTWNCPELGNGRPEREATST
jgi:hypothetical protein